MPAFLRAHTIPCTRRMLVILSVNRNFAGARVDADPSVHRGPAGPVRRGDFPAGGGAPSRLPAPGGQVDGAGQRDAHHGGLEANGRLVPRLLVGVRTKTKFSTSDKNGSLRVDQTDLPIPPSTVMACMMHGSGGCDVVGTHTAVLPPFLVFFECVCVCVCVCVLFSRKRGPAGYPLHW